MGIFTRKPKVRLEEFCRDFYDEQLFNAKVGTKEIDVTKTYAKVVLQSLVDADSSLTDITAEELVAEFIPLRLEVFGLAWLHRLGDKRAAEQSHFTKCYLGMAGRSDIWEAMEPYNLASSRSSTLGHTGDTALGRGYITFVNEMRAALFDEWLKLGYDDNAVARAANRVATDEAWKKGLTPALLMCAICEQLGCEPNERAQSRLQAVVRGFYDGVATSLKQVSIQG